MLTKPTTTNLKSLLFNTRTTIKHQNEITELKGEHFNLFSVLNIEARENKTHSNFLAELLDPKGCHRQGAIFLKLFLEVIGKDFETKIGDNPLMGKFINSRKTRVFKEYYIGKRDDVEKTGGRIDIMIRNGENSIIKVECAE